VTPRPKVANGLPISRDIWGGNARVAVPLGVPHEE
jgi:hypothetical protein